MVYMRRVQEGATVTWDGPRFHRVSRSQRRNSRHLTRLPSLTRLALDHQGLSTAVTLLMWRLLQGIFILSRMSA
jgi:hypothetical protein